MKEDNTNINAKVTGLLMSIGIVLIIFGSMVLSFMFLGLDDDLGLPIILFGVAFILLGFCFLWGYITKRILKNSKGSFALGFFLGLIGVIIAACIKPKEVTVNNSNKYENLEKLQKLKENGTITNAEFEIEKEKLLK